MPIYQYKGLNAKGKPVADVFDAESPRTLRTELRKQGVYLTEYAEQGKGGKAKTAVVATGKKTTGSREVKLNFLTKIPLTTVAEMTRQLSTLLRAGVPVVDALAAIVEQTEDERLTAVMAQVRRSVNEGAAMNQALREHPKVFPNIYCNMVKAGESSGTLELVFQRLADFIESQVRLRSKITTALMYPAIMITFASLIVILLMTFVVPRLVEVIVEQGGELPWITEALIWFSELIRDWLWLIAIGGVAAYYWFGKWKVSKTGELTWDRFKLRMPLFGDLFRKIIMARFARTLGTLMGAGVPLLTAIDICKHVVDSPVYRDVLEGARVAIRDGDSIAGPLKRSGHFPPMVTQMITIGEKTGEVEEMLDNVAGAYELQVDSKVSRMTTLLEPMMIVVLGVIVAAIVFAVLLPMLNMNEALKGGA